MISGQPMAPMGCPGNNLEKPHLAWVKPLIAGGTLQMASIIDNRTKHWKERLLPSTVTL